MLTSVGARARLLAGLLILGLLHACGGGGGGGGGGTQQPVGSAPVITAHPQSVEVDVGASASFSVTATGQGTLIYQWFRNGTVIAGANAATYEISEPMPADNQAVFSVRVSNSFGAILSQDAVLTVHSGAPVISEAPKSQTVVAGQPVTLHVAAHGSLPLRFQWRKYGLDIPGANTADYISPTLAPVDSGTVFDVVVSNDFASIPSPAATIAVQAVAGEVSIESQSQTDSLVEGGVATFGVVASGTGPWTYQWRRNGKPIVGAYDATYRFAASHLNDGDQYSVDVMNALGLASSSPATLSVARGAISLQLGHLGSNGNTNGIADQARFGCPTGVVSDAAGNLYVASTGSGGIRRISPTQQVSMFVGTDFWEGYVDGVGSDARLRGPSGIAIDKGGNLFVTDTRNSVIRKITPNGEVTTLAGQPGVTGSSDGPGYLAQFNFVSWPQTCELAGIAVDAAGYLYVADTLNHTIRKVSPAGEVTTLAGAPGQASFADGKGAAARFNRPTGIAIDGSGKIFVADSYNGRVRMIDADGNVTSLSKVFDKNSGTENTESVSGIAVDKAGRLYVSEYTGYIWRSDTNRTAFSKFTGLCSDECGFGELIAPFFNEPQGLYLDASDNLLIAGNHEVKKVRQDQRVSILAGKGPFWNVLRAGETKSDSVTFDSQDFVVDSNGNIFVGYGISAIVKITPTGESSIFAGDPAESGTVDGAKGVARLSSVTGLAIDHSNNLYVSQGGVHTVRKVSPDGAIVTIAGAANQSGSADGQASSARFNNPRALAVDGSGNVYVSDVGNFTIRKISASGAVTTIAGTAGVAESVDGTGTNAHFTSPRRLTVDTAGNVYVLDVNFGTVVRKISPAGVVTSIGHYDYPPTDGTSTTAKLFSVQGITADANGNVYVTDLNTVRKISPSGDVTTVVGTYQSQGVLLGALPGSLNDPQAIVAVPSISGTKLLVVSEGSLLSITLP